MTSSQPVASAPAVAPTRHVARLVALLAIVLSLLTVAGPDPVAVPPPTILAASFVEPDRDLTDLAAVVRHEADQRALVDELDEISEDQRFAVSVRDQATGFRFDHGTGRFRTASLVKIHLVALMTWRADRSGGRLTGSQRRDAEEMLVRSDNDAALRAYQALGGPPGIERGLESAFGTAGVRIGENTFWGRSTTRPRDVVALLQRVLATNRTAARRYAVLQDAMSRVIPEQRWGIPVLADDGTRAQVKVGWFEAPTGWVANSSGRVMIDGSPVLISVMTDRNSTLEAGIKTVEEVARIAGEVVRAQRRQEGASAREVGR